MGRGVPMIGVAVGGRPGGRSERPERGIEGRSPPAGDEAGDPAPPGRRPEDTGYIGPEDTGLIGADPGPLGPDDGPPMPTFVPRPPAGPPSGFDPGSLATGFAPAFVACEPGAFDPGP